jgi:hypothetical protein
MSNNTLRQLNYYDITGIGDSHIIDIHNWLENNLKNLISYLNEDKELIYTRKNVHLKTVLIEQRKNVKQIWIHYRSIYSPLLKKLDNDEITTKKIISSYLYKYYNISKCYSIDSIDELHGRYYFPDENVTLTR